MGRRLHPAARAEDAFNAALAKFLAFRRWGVQVLPYTGYGSTQFARTLGRVVLAKTGEPEDDAALEALHTRRGIWAFFAAPLRNVPVRVTVGEASVEARTDRGGYFDIEVRDHGLQPGWHQARIEADGVEASARVQIISPEARFGIISDIDDTCLITTLPRPMIAAWNTFVLEEAARKVVPGMAAMYRSILAHNPEAPIIYLSTGAWNTQPTLSRFMRRHGFPFGAMLLTDWGPTDSRIFRSGQQHKKDALRRLAAEFPNIKWLLVGDDGQHDPRLYEDFAMEYPDHVDGIAIRQLTMTQQVLSHGHPLSHDEMTGRPVRRPVFEGPDGYTLHRLVQGARSVQQKDVAPPKQMRTSLVTPAGASTEGDEHA